MSARTGGTQQKPKSLMKKLLLLNVRWTTAFLHSYSDWDGIGQFHGSVFVNINAR